MFGATSTADEVLAGVDLKGKRFVFGPAFAPTAYLSPYWLLLEAGIDPRTRSDRLSRARCDRLAAATQDVGERLRVRVRVRGGDRLRGRDAAVVAGSNRFYRGDLAGGLGFRHRLQERLGLLWLSRLQQVQRLCVTGIARRAFGDRRDRGAAADAALAGGDDGDPAARRATAAPGPRAGDAGPAHDRPRGGGRAGARAGRAARPAAPSP